MNVDTNDCSWSLGRTNPVKVIHRPGCRYALQPYRWAGVKTANEIAAELVASGANTWHSACGICAFDLRDALALRVIGSHVERR